MMSGTGEVVNDPVKIFRKRVLIITLMSFYASQTLTFLMLLLPIPIATDHVREDPTVQIEREHTNRIPSLKNSPAPLQIQTKSLAAAEP